MEGSMDDPKSTNDRDERELVISDPAVVADIKKLSARTGETPARAVHTAVEQRLRQVSMTPRSDKDREDLFWRLRALSEEGARNKLPDATSDHSFLYDDKGLPV
jgi:hypothetical protein